mmetsp:Transcript_20197/g.63796  ORF Transcript_20197/g.63796 Transcript_20197/m.63796 type:complete len:561 (-) Transcript_20197:228-1910(-)
MTAPPPAATRWMRASEPDGRFGISAHPPLPSPVLLVLLRGRRCEQVQVESRGGAEEESCAAVQRLDLASCVDHAQVDVERGLLLCRPGICSAWPCAGAWSLVGSAQSATEAEGCLEAGPRWKGVGARDELVDALLHQGLEILAHGRRHRCELEHRVLHTRLATNAGVCKGVAHSHVLRGDGVQRGADGGCGEQPEPQRYALLARGGRPRPSASGGRRVRAGGQAGGAPSEQGPRADRAHAPLHLYPQVQGHHIHLVRGGRAGAFSVGGGEVLLVDGEARVHAGGGRRPRGAPWRAERLAPELRPALVGSSVEHGARGEQEGAAHEHDDQREPRKAHARGTRGRGDVQQPARLGPALLVARRCPSLARVRPLSGEAGCACPPPRPLPRGGGRRLSPQLGEDALDRVCGRVPALGGNCPALGGGGLLGAPPLASKGLRHADARAHRVPRAHAHGHAEAEARARAQRRQDEHEGHEACRCRARAPHVGTATRAQRAPRVDVVQGRGHLEVQRHRQYGRVGARRAGRARAEGEAGRGGRGDCRVQRPSQLLVRVQRPADALHEG